MPTSLRSPVVRWILRAGVGLGLAAALYLGYVLVRHAQPVSLPAPTGTYHVGRVLGTWTDGSRADSLSPGRAAGPRRLAVWLWFPSTARPSRRAAAPYLPGAWSGLHLPAPVGWAETGFGKVDAHTLARVPAAPGRFPLVVLLPGLGFAAPQYSSLAVDIASHGFVVAGVTPTYSARLTVLDGRPVPSSAAGNPSALSGERTPASTRAALHLMRVWADDARFVAARVRAGGVPGPIAGHVDGAHVVFMGHSFGGTSALEACRVEPRCAGAIDLDGAQFGPVVARGLPVPLLVVGHRGSCVAAPCAPRTASDRADLSVARRLLAHSHGHAWSVSIDGTRHFDFSDYAAYYLALPLRALLPLGSLDGDRALEITAGCVDDFLAGSFGGLLAEQQTHPEAHVRRW